MFADHPYRPLIGARPEDGGQRGPDADPFRPLTRDDKPRVHGVESAVVVGPEGDEIFTDEHGRVRVQFPWDREGAFDARRTVLAARQPAGHEARGSAR